MGMCDLIELLREYNIEMTIDPCRHRGLDDAVVIELRKGNHRMNYAISEFDRIKSKSSLVFDDLVDELITQFDKEVERKERIEENAR